MKKIIALLSSLCLMCLSIMPINAIEVTTPADDPVDDELVTLTDVLISTYCSGGNGYWAIETRGTVTVPRQLVSHSYSYVGQHGTGFDVDVVYRDTLGYYYNFRLEGYTNGYTQETNSATYCRGILE